MACYSIIAAIYGAIWYIVVRFFAFLMLLVTHCFLQIAIWTDSSTGVDKLTAIWPKPEFMNLLGSPEDLALTGTESLAAFVIRLFLLVVLGLVVSFIISFYFSANTIIYSLMRKRVDTTALSDVCTHFDEAEIESSTAELKPGQ